VEFADGEEFTVEDPTPRGEGWNVPGLEELGEIRVHPVHLIEPETEILFDLWQDGRERRSLPDAGGLFQQSAKVLEAFAIIDGTVAALKAARRGNRKG